MLKRDRIEINQRLWILHKAWIVKSISIFQADRESVASSTKSLWLLLIGCSQVQFVSSVASLSSAFEMNQVKRSNWQNFAGTLTAQRQPIVVYVLSLSLIGLFTRQNDRMCPFVSSRPVYGNQVMVLFIVKGSNLF